MESFHKCYICRKELEEACNKGVECYDCWLQLSEEEQTKRGLEHKAQRALNLYYMTIFRNPFNPYTGLESK